MRTIFHYRDHAKSSTDDITQMKWNALLPRFALGTKILFFLVATSAVTLLTLYLVFHRVLHAMIHDVEQKTNEAALDTTRNAFLQLEVHWESAAQMDALNPALIGAIQRGDVPSAGGWLDRRMDEMSPPPSAVCLLSPSGAVVHSHGDLLQCAGPPVRKPIESLLKQATEAGGKAGGVLQVDAGLWMAGASAIPGPDGTAHPAGFLLYFKETSPAVLDGLRPSPDAEVALVAESGGPMILSASSNTGALIRPTGASTPGVERVTVLSDQQITSWAEITDVTGGQRLLLGLSSPRSLSLMFESIIHRTLLFTAWLCLLACFLLAYYAVLVFVRPIAETAKAIARMGDPGGAPGALPAQRRDEFGALAHAFNRLMAQLGRSQQELVRKNREVTLLLSIATAMNEPEPLDRRLSVILQLVVDSFKLVGGAIHLLDPARSVLRLAAHCGLRDEWVRHNFEIKDEENPAGRAVASGSPAGAPQLEYPCSLCVPIRAAGRLIGTLCVMDIKPRDFTPEDEVLLAAVAHQVGVAIQNNRLAQETRRLEEFSQRIVQGLQEAILLEDTDGRVTFANPRACALFGYAPDELVGLPSIHLVAPEEVDHVRTESARRPAGASSIYESQVVTSGGERIPVLVSATSQFDDSGFRGVLVALTDLRPLKQARGDVQRMRDYLLKIIEASPDYVLTANHDRSIAFFGSRWLELTSLSESQITGYDYFSLLPESILPEVEAHWALALHGRASSFETTVRKTDQTLIPVIASFIPLESGGQVLVSLRDVSEERRIHERLMQSEKLAALGEIMAGVAHEINNPLGAVIGFSEMLMDTPHLDEQSRDFAHKVRESGNRVHRIVQNLLLFSRQHEPDFNLYDLNEVVSNTLELRSYNLRLNNIEVARKLDSSVPKSLGDPYQLQQVFFNVILNAEQAIASGEKGGHLLVQTEYLPGEEKMRVVFTDDGPGIPLPLLKRIFDPFFTTKKPGKGTGLGLSLSYGIVKNHDGDIWAESVPGRQTRFIIEFPVKKPADALPSVNPPEVLPRVESPLAGHRFLLVDDEPIIHDMLALFFARYHSELVWASNGKEALSLVTRRGDFDLVFCDLLMPEMDGMSLYNQLEAIRHPLVERFVFLTGDITREHTANFLRESGRPYLLKPFALNALRDLLLELLPPRISRN